MGASRRPEEMAPLADVAPEAQTAVGCHACGSGSIEVLSGAGVLKGVTSDCKPWPRAGQIAVCRYCGLIQKVHDPDWYDTISQVYGAYTIYHQSSDGAEQAVFDRTSGLSAPRSVRLLRRLMTECALPARGRLL